MRSCGSALLAAALVPGAYPVAAQGTLTSGACCSGRGRRAAGRNRQRRNPRPLVVEHPGSPRHLARRRLLRQSEVIGTGSRAP